MVAPPSADGCTASLSDDVDLNSVASIPGMGIPEQLKAAMEQEHSSKPQNICPACWVWAEKVQETDVCSSFRRSQGSPLLVCR